MEYYDTVFNQHLSCWLSDVCLSQTIDFDTKKELIDKSIPLFNQMTNVKPFPDNEPIKNMITAINSNDLKSTYKQMKKYKKDHEKSIKKQALKNKLKDLKNRF